MVRAFLLLDGSRADEAERPPLELEFVFLSERGGFIRGSWLADDADEGSFRERFLIGERGLGWIGERDRPGRCHRRLADDFGRGGRFSHVGVFGSARCVQRGRRTRRP